MFRTNGTLTERGLPSAGDGESSEKIGKINGNGV